MIDKGGDALLYPDLVVHSVYPRLPARLRFRGPRLHNIPSGPAQASSPSTSITSRDFPFPFVFGSLALHRALAILNTMLVASVSGQGD